MLNEIPIRKEALKNQHVSRRSGIGLTRLLRDIPEKIRDAFLAPKHMTTTEWCKRMRKLFPESTKPEKSIDSIT